MTSPVATLADASDRLPKVELHCHVEGNAPGDGRGAGAAQGDASSELVEGMPHDISAL